MIDWKREELFPLSELRLRMPKSEWEARTSGKKKRPHYHTVLSWWKVGRWNASRTRRVRLEAVKTTTGWATSLEAYWRFMEALNSDADEAGDEA